MRKIAPHFLAVGITAFWIRFGLSPVLTHSSAFLSGGACFIGEISVAQQRSLDGASFSWFHLGFSLLVAVCGALLVALPAVILNDLIQRGHARPSIPVFLSAVFIALGALPFIFCRFPVLMFSPTSVVAAYLMVIFAAGLTFTVYWFVLYASMRGRWWFNTGRPTESTG